MFCCVAFLSEYSCTCINVTFIQLADAMELMLLSVLSPAVQCEWGLTKSEEATITSVSTLSVCNASSIVPRFSFAQHTYKFDLEPT